MAKRKRKRGARKFTLPIAVIAGLGAGLALPINWALAGNYNEAFYTLSRSYTGYDPVGGTWNPESLKHGLLPLVIGGLVHKFVGGPPLNLNKMLAAANVPVLRI